jgi:hypothetical protein
MRGATETWVKPSTEVREALLAVNRPALPFVVRDGSPEKVDLVAEWHIVDGLWCKLFANAGLDKTFKILMRLDADKHEVRAVDQAWLVEWLGRGSTNILSCSAVHRVAGACWAWAAVVAGTEFASIVPTVRTCRREPPMRRSLGRHLTVSTAASATTWRATGEGAAGKRYRAVYARTGTDVAFIISELPGGRAEGLLYCNGSVGVHGGRAIHTTARAEVADRAVFGA